MTTTRTRRTAPVEGQLGMTLGMLAERPGSQLDLIAEAGVETVGPSVTRAPRHDPAAERLAALGCDGCINAAHRH